MLAELFTSFFKVLREVNCVRRKYCFVSGAEAWEMKVKYKKLLGVDLTVVNNSRKHTIIFILWKLASVSFLCACERERQGRREREAVYMQECLNSFNQKNHFE